MQVESVLPWQIMPGNKILHRIEGAVRVTFTWPDGLGGTYIEYRDRYGLLASFRCGPFERVLKVMDRGGLF